MYSNLIHTCELLIDARPPMKLIVALSSNNFKRSSSSWLRLKLNLSCLNRETFWGVVRYQRLTLLVGLVGLALALATPCWFILCSIECRVSLYLLHTEQCPCARSVKK